MTAHKASSGIGSSTDFRSPDDGMSGDGYSPLPKSSISADPAYPPARRAYYALGVLMIVSFTALLDRYLTALLLDPIRSDFQISDTQASLLQGFAFAMFYSVLGLPFGRWVDRGSRRNILLLGVLCWTITTISCSVAPNYTTLFFARLGVGVGEACLVPAAYSFLSDCFPPHRHGRAFAAFTLGSVIGGGGSYIVGAQAFAFAQVLVAPDGPLAGMTAWRVTFVLVGAPGLAVALLMLTISEPARQARGRFADLPSLAELGAFLRQAAVPFWTLTFAGAIFTFAGAGIMTWLAVFAARTYGMPVTTGGSIIGIYTIVAGLVASAIAGPLCDSRWIARMTGEKLNVVAAAIAAALPLSLLYPLAPTAHSALLIWVICGTFFTIQACAIPATLQDILPNRFKGQGTAIYTLCVGLLGLGGGATAVALVTQHVFGDDASLRYALLIVPPAALFSGAIALFAVRRRYQDLRDALRSSAVE